MTATVRDGVAAGAIGALVAGLPSTAHALVRTGRPLEATLAAGSLLLPDESRHGRLLAAAVPVHVGISLAWGTALAALLPRRRTTAYGALAGLAIAAIDLGIAGRRFERVRSLPLLPQVADHVAYGATVGAVVSRRRGRRESSAGPSPSAAPPAR